MKKNRRIKKIPLSNALFLELLRGEHHYNITKGVPKDGKIIDARFNGFNETIDLLVESKKFKSVPEGDPIPNLEIIVTDRFADYLSSKESKQ